MIMIFYKVGFQICVQSLQFYNKLQQKMDNQAHHAEEKHSETVKPAKQYRAAYTLLGDVGGTNVRFSLGVIQPPHNVPNKIVKKQTYKVVECESFEGAIKKFLTGVPAEQYPEVAVIGIAGPVEDNKVTLSNVQRWGELDGDKLKESLKLKHFVFLNDFIANSYGLLLLPQDNFISLNGIQANPKHTRGVLGPGTGLGNSIIFSAPFRKRERIYVLPSQNGHGDSPYINDLIAQYYKFLAEKLGVESVGLEYSFCGPAIPFMYQFFALKNPAYEGAHLKPTSEQIIKSFNENPQADTLQKKTVDLFVELYSSAICNFVIGHMCTGGIYLVGSLTNAVLQKLKKTNLTEKFCLRHPQIAKIVKKTPIIVSKEVNLGIKGAFVYARRIIADEQHE